MKKSVSPYFVFTLVLIAILIVLFSMEKREKACDTVKTLLTSIIVKSSDGFRHIGFDLNKQNLTFGTLSPGSVS